MPLKGGCHCGAVKYEVERLDSLGHCHCITCRKTHSAAFNTAGRVARELVQRFSDTPFAEPILLNVNVPDVPYEELRGIQVTRLGRRHKAEPAVKSVSPRGETLYWIGAAGPAADAGEGTDFHAVEHGWVSVTPLQIDLTHAAQLAGVRSWLKLDK